MIAHQASKKGFGLPTLHSLKMRSNLHLVLILATLIMWSWLLPGTVHVAHAQSTPGLQPTMFVPAYVTAGSNLTYEITLKNTSSSTIANISVQIQPPANTTYVSGGTLVSGQTYNFDIGSLAAGAQTTVNFVVKVSDSATVGTPINQTTFGVFIGNDGIPTSPSTTLVEAPGQVVAIYKDKNGTAFDPKLHGYGFANYGNSNPTRNFNNDLLPADLFTLLGPKVCQSGSTANDCVLSGPAQKWLDGQIKSANGGHCEGMAITSPRFFEQLTFKGKRVPSDYQSNAANTAALNFPADPLENYMMYYFVTQAFDEVNNAHTTAAPNAILDKLTAEFQKSSPVAHTIHIFKMPGYKEGHAITAYGVEKVTETEYRILVYDNNFPRQRRYITVNRTNNTWRYATAASPGQPVDVYEGTATSGNLRTTPVSARDLPAGQYFTCDFCNNQSTAQATVSAAGVNQTAGTIRFEYAGEGAILVVNDEDQATGYDFNTETFVEEIPGAEVTHFLGGLGKEIPPTIDVPYVEADEALYSVFISGKTIDSDVDGALTMSTAGYVLGLDFIELSPDELLEVAVSPDGDFIGFSATEGGLAPLLYIAYDPLTPEDPSVIFEVDGVFLDPDEQVSLELDPDLEQVFFDDTGALGQDFDVYMTLIWPDGETETFTQTVNVPAGATSAFIDFGAWDGLLDPPLYVDDELQNPMINHRLQLSDVKGTFDATPQPNAPAGLYHIEATFTNVTEVSLEDLYFTVAGLGAGNVLLNADGGPAGVGGKVSVPADALGDDGLLDPNEQVTFHFEVGLATTDVSELIIDANGIPYDWYQADPAPSYDANNDSFVFAVTTVPTPDACDPVPGNLVVNGGFETGKGPWQFYSDSGGSWQLGTPATECTTAAQITIANGGSNIQLYQSGIALKANTNYRLHFAAYSNSGHDLGVYLHKHGAPYNNYGLAWQRVDLGMGWQVYTIEFTTSDFSGSVNDARLRFWLAPFAQAGDMYWIDDVQLTEVAGDNDTPPPTTVSCAPVTGNVIQNGNFESNLMAWKFYTDSSGSVSVGNPPAGCLNAAQMQINSSGSNVQLYQKEITLEANTEYQLRFAAYSNTGADLAIYLHNHVAPYQNYGLAVNQVNLGTGWQIYTVNFTTSGFSGTVNNARLRFWLAPFTQAGDIYWIDAVSLSKVAGVTGAQAQDVEPPIVITNSGLLIGLTAAEFDPVLLGLIPDGDNVGDAELNNRIYVPLVTR